jgi:hypothetical protein
MAMGVLLLRRCKMNIGIVGARKYQDRQFVKDHVNSPPEESL